MDSKVSSAVELECLLPLWARLAPLECKKYATYYRLEGLSVFLRDPVDGYLLDIEYRLRDTLAVRKWSWQIEQSLYAVAKVQKDVNNWQKSWAATPCTALLRSYVMQLASDSNVRLWGEWLDIEDSIGDYAWTRLGLNL